MAAATTKPTTTIDWTALRREALLRRLRGNVEGDLRFDAASRALYSTDASLYQIEPIGVVIPKTTADVATTVEIAVEQHIPLIPRGGGTSLSGQSIGAGLIIDFRKHLNAVLETDIAQHYVRVQPGVVLADLNRHLAPLGFQFGPDVATIDRANIGGMIGNNSAGARSIKYGKTIDHVIELSCLLTDGKQARFGSATPIERSMKKTADDREAGIYRTVERILADNADEIRARFPKVLRRVSGYNLDALLPPADFNLAKLIVGSEGTLATVVEAKLNIVPLPQHRGLAVLHFASLEAALDSLASLLPTEPSAVELLDEMILDLARASTVFRGNIDFVAGRPKAILLVEYQADEPQAIKRMLDDLQDCLAGTAVGPALRFEDARQTEHVWNVRKTAMPLLYTLPGDRKPITFVEDTAVDPAQLPRFVARFKELLARHGTTGSFYGHASVGCLHIRPLLDLRARQGVDDMRTIAREVVDLVMEFGGALSGEHGDGLARSEFNRQLFGDQIYEAFRQVKRAFDPQNLMNPGKIVEAPAMSDSLRIERLAPAGPTTRLSFEREGNMPSVVNRCNGNGICQRVGVGTMCPSYMATRDEEHSPRGRANLLRSALEGRLDTRQAANWTDSAQLDAALDLCLMCKACKTECPLGVDIAKLKSEFLFQSHQHRRPGMLARALADLPHHARLGSALAPLSNWLIRSWPARLLLDRFAGIDRRRKLPSLKRQTLANWFARRPVVRKPHGKVVLLADCFTNYFEPKTGQDAVWLLEAAGFQVQLVSLCCGRTAISKGFLDEAGNLAREGIDRLYPFAAAGAPIVGVEPSCLLTLVDEWCDLAPGPAASMIARSVRPVETFLNERRLANACDLPAATGQSLEVMLHGHCHQKSAGELAGSARALADLANVKPIVLDSGCCGMAGSFGYEKAHYELSRQIFQQRLGPAIRKSPNTPLVAVGFSCRSQIADLAGRRALHPVQLIRERLAHLDNP